MKEKGEEETRCGAYRMLWSAVGTLGLIVRGNGIFLVGGGGDGTCWVGLVGGVRYLWVEYA